MGDGQCEDINKKSIKIKLNQTYEGQRGKISLQIGLSRPPTCKKILEHGSSLGVKSFEFFHGALSEKSYATSKLFQENKAQETMHLGLSQSNIYCHEPCLNIVQKRSIPETEHKYILSLDNNLTFSDYISKSFPQDLTLALGPERGWTKDEEKELLSQGYRPVRIGPSTLRVEIATFVALGQLSLIASQLKDN